MALALEGRFGSFLTSAKVRMGAKREAKNLPDDVKCFLSFIKLRRKTRDGKASPSPNGLFSGSYLNADSRKSMTIFSSFSCISEDFSC